MGTVIALFSQRKPIAQKLPEFSRSFLNVKVVLGISLEEFWTVSLLDLVPFGSESVTPEREVRKFR